MKIQVRETGLVELICPHQVGHPSRILTEATGRRFRKVDAVHGCCAEGCCTSEYYQRREAEFAGATRRKARG